ncbi:hypothetical protein Mycsm_01869 [Mycobacterium sp. JS623]|uniref:hypothetical protein n=1 Tax=Mycobacterium sp. JS623 TaxID=212767 RepID=UPI0002A55AFC|nr:hypothetical protein [Mycobacterium sp. JS623]AGB22248.1 hypothetical protein Mycsm_01869 [Mycobacterium sp. JS623]
METGQRATGGAGEAPPPAGPAGRRGAPAAKHTRLTLPQRDGTPGRGRPLCVKGDVALKADPPTSLGRYEWAMVEFIRRWYRFGGGSARDIFEQFGLGEQEFFTRVLDLVQAVAPAEALGLPAMAHNDIRKVCRWRLHILAPSTNRSTSAKTDNRRPADERLAPPQQCRRPAQT